MLYMFRTILVHHQEQLYKLYIAYTGIYRSHTCGCYVAIATQQPRVSAYAKYDVKHIELIRPDVPECNKYDVQLIKLLLMMD